MIRTQISLSEEQMACLRDLARRRNVSIAAVVRDAVGRALADDERDRRLQRALQAAREGPGRSGRGDVSRNHDAHLPDAFDR